MGLTWKLYGKHHELWYSSDCNFSSLYFQRLANPSINCMFKYSLLSTWTANSHSWIIPQYPAIIHVIPTLLCSNSSNTLTLPSYCLSSEWFTWSKDVFKTTLFCLKCGSYKQMGENSHLYCCSWFLFISDTGSTSSAYSWFCCQLHPKTVFFSPPGVGLLSTHTVRPVGSQPQDPKGFGHCNFPRPRTRWCFLITDTHGTWELPL